jgi:hypothetical protein
VSGIDPALHERLEHWGRWARTRRWLSFCRSIEHKYRAPAGQVWEREPKPLPIDALDAWDVECTWRTTLPLRERLILRAYFVTAPGGSGERRTSDEWHAYVRRQCRALAIPKADWEHAVAAAARMLGNQLHKSEKCGRIMDSSSDRPGKDATATAALGRPFVHQKRAA